MPISKEQWDAIEVELNGVFGRVELLCDGHSVIAEIKSIAPLKLGILVYIDGVIKGEWWRGENEVARKFHREVKRFLYSAKDREYAKAQLKKRGMTELLRETWQKRITLCMSHWHPWWTNAKSFRRHIGKTCKEIEVVKIGYGA